MRAASAVPELAGVLRRARTTDEFDALAHILNSPGLGLDIIDETFTELWTARIMPTGLKALITIDSTSLSTSK